MLWRCTPLLLWGSEPLLLWRWELCLLWDRQGVGFLWSPDSSCYGTGGGGSSYLEMGAQLLWYMQGLVAMKIGAQLLWDTQGLVAMGTHRWGQW